MTVEYDTWSNPGLLEENRKRIVRAALQKMRRYEARYELLSSSVEEEMNAGRLVETAEICDWLIAYHRYLMVEGRR